MTLGDELQAVLPELRQMAESRMTTTIEIRHLTGKTDQDEETGEEVPLYVSEGELLCRIPPAKTAASSDDSGGQLVIRTEREVHISTSAAEIPSGRILVVTQPGVGADPTLAGAMCRVVDSSGADQATARRMRVEWIRPMEMQEAP